MTDQEREQVLKMIENGTISAEDGLKLMQTLEKTPAEADTPTLPPGNSPETDAQAGGSPEQEVPHEDSRFEFDPRIEQVKSTARKLWQIPLWIGIFITFLSAWGMFSLVQSNHLNFWFYCLTAPLLLGVLVIVAAAGSRYARWLFVDVKQKPGQKPGHIFLGFPLPLKLAAWGMRTFGHYIPEMDRPKVSGIAQVIETGLNGDDPLVVNVDDGDDGEQVRVYIG